MKRLHIVGIGAIAAAFAAFFLHPRKGADRREAVRRGGGRLARRGAKVTSLVGTRRRRAGAAVAGVGARIEDALLEELGADGFSLRVIAGDDDTLTVRGEVGSLELIRRASEVIERARGGADVVNLIRLRAPSGGGALAT
jgi:osmotically-inducible protein OsmY